MNNELVPSTLKLRKGCPVSPTLPLPPPYSLYLLIYLPLLFSYPLHLPIVLLPLSQRTVMEQDCCSLPLNPQTVTKLYLLQHYPKIYVKKRKV